MYKTLKSLIILFIVCNLSSINKTVAQKVDPLFPNSIVSTDIDFIMETDVNHFTSLEFKGREDKEMPGNSDDLIDKNTFVFEATFSNNKVIGIWCHSSFETEEEALDYANKVCPRLGKLPLVQRDMLDHVVINKGDHTAFAETEGHFFILYSENMDARISTNDLEETVFHESVHASIQDLYENDTAWTNAQDADGNYITQYAQSKPHLEDMPETAIFAYTMIKYPGRLSSDIENWILVNIPNKLNFFESIYGNNTVEIQEKSTEPKFKIYPNPTQENITLEFQESQKRRKVFIYNATGNCVQTIMIEEKNNLINLNHLPNGVYFVQVDMHIGKYNQKQLIIKQ